MVSYSSIIPSCFTKCTTTLASYRINKNTEVTFRSLLENVLVLIVSGNSKRRDNAISREGPNCRGSLLDSGGRPLATVSAAYSISYPIVRGALYH